MTEMEWALFGVKYLAEARSSAHDEFNEVMNEVRQHHVARSQSWYSVSKNIIQTLYHYSQEFPGDGKIPGEQFSSPGEFALRLEEYKGFLQQMLTDLDKEDELYRKKAKVDGPPFLVTAVRERVAYMLGAVDYVISKNSDGARTQDPMHELNIVVGLASRFHESVFALSKHPHGGKMFAVTDEWDCQYLFRAILAAYFRDVRTEEWNPSVAGSAARCEFFLKQPSLMIELKYVRRPDDQKKIKTELVTDLRDYGANPGVNYVVALVYDPNHQLPAPVQLQDDISGPTNGLKDVKIVVSPPR